MFVQEYDLRRYGVSNQQILGEMARLVLQSREKLEKAKTKHADFAVTTFAHIKQLQDKNKELVGKLQEALLFQKSNDAPAQPLLETTFLLTLRDASDQLWQTQIEKLNTSYVCGNYNVKVIANDDNKALAVVLQKDTSSEKATKMVELKQAVEAQDFGRVSELSSVLQELSKEPALPTYACYRMNAQEGTDDFMHLLLDYISIKFTIQPIKRV